MDAQKITSEFVDILKKQELYHLLPEVTALLQEEVLRNQDITVISAAPLTSNETEEIKTSLFKKWGEHRLLFYVDPAILSGLIVSFQDKVLDTSGKQRLVQLQQQLNKS